jgi:RNA polymerase sigma factor (sigma-70 family)
VSDTRLLLTSAILKPISGTTDGDLLAAFVGEQSEAAFAELMQRHGAMVFAVARRLLRSPTDAEDVSQATFLLLARKAATLRKERSLAGWLYGVTRRLCADLRKQQRRRARREGLAQQQRDTSTASPPLLQQQEVLLKLDNELARLSGTLREPLVLYCLEGLTHQEIASRLGVALGTVASRLHRAKELLKSRLVRRGVASASCVAIFSGLAHARLTPTLSMPAAHAAQQHLSVHTMVSQSASQLYQGALSMYMRRNLQLAAAAALLGSLSLWGAGSLLASPPAPEYSFVTTSPLQQDDDLQKLQGTWYCLGIFSGKQKLPAAEMERIRKVRMKIQGDQLTMENTPESKSPTTIKLDTKTSPKRMHLEQAGVRAVYTLDGDVLIITFEEGATKDYPKSLAVTSELNGGMMLMQRVPPPPTGELVLETPVPRTSKVVAQNNMRQIGLAFHNYVDAKDTFPTNISSADGKPLLSWRVRLLPFLNEDALYRQFKLDEPWDSPHNKPLLSKMPKYFAADANNMTEFTTPFRGFSGPGAVFENTKLHFNMVKDDTSNTIMFAEAEGSVPWSKPDDLPFDQGKPLPKLGKRFDNEIQVIMLDGSARSIPASVSEGTIKALITRSGGEKVK